MRDPRCAVRLGGAAIVLAALVPPWVGASGGPRNGYSQPFVVSYIRQWEAGPPVPPRCGAGFATALPVLQSAGAFRAEGLSEPTSVDVGGVQVLLRKQQAH